LSYIADLLVMGLAILLLIFALSPANPSEDTFIFFVVAPIFFFYTLLMEVLNDGRSLGKMMVGLRVVRIDGRPVTAYDYLMRWIFRWLDIYMTSGCMAVLMIAGSPRGQRIGDLLADTTVIQTRQSRVSLKRIMKLAELGGYQPRYPNVVQLSEQQMMLVKQVLVRQSKIPGAGHMQALAETASRLRNMLSVEKKQSASDRQFLETLIKDYIALTR